MSEATAHIPPTNTRSPLRIGIAGPVGSGKTALAQGIELPYSCKGGVCATCRTYLREGRVRMHSNYALEPWEVDKGFVLACQSEPLTDAIVIDYDHV